MERALIGLVVTALSLAGASRSSAQTVYTQTNRVCELYQCVKATFTPPASLSYFLPEVFHRGDAPGPFTNQYAYWCTGSTTCTQTEYQDFNGTLARTYNGIDPNCPKSVSCWEITGTFNAGQESIDAKWQCFRSCGAAYFVTVTDSTSSAKAIPLCGKDRHPCDLSVHAPGTCWWDGKGADWQNIKCNYKLTYWIAETMLTMDEVHRRGKN